MSTNYKFATIVSFIFTGIFAIGFSIVDLRLCRLEGYISGQTDARTARPKRDAKWDAQVAEFDKEMDAILKSGDYDRILKVTLLPP